VLGKIREIYWLQSGRKTVGRIIRKCTLCRRFKRKPLKYEEAPLPLATVETKFAFKTTEVDLLGPIILKRNKKVSIVLYTLAVYRGVYLDHVDTLTTEEFLDSLEKFTCLIGRPAIYLATTALTWYQPKKL